MPDLVTASNDAADAVKIPRLLLLSCAVAESNLNARARRPSDPLQDADYWTDVSMGAWQQTVRWSQEYKDWYTSAGHAAAQFPGSHVTEQIGALYYDAEYAARVAARQLKAHYRPTEDDAIFKALCRYNWPAGDGAPKGAAQATNYRRGIAEAERVLAAAPVPAPPPVPGVIMPSDPWTRTQLITAGFSTPAEWPIAAPRPIQALVWHDMEGHLAGAIATWNQGAAGAHLCVLEDGTIVRTCLIENIAWHAGTNDDPNGGVYGRTPFWRAHNINPFSIGIELEGFTTSGYTQAQIDACVRIGQWARDRYGIAPVHTVDQIAGHHLHGELSSSRSDPGPRFPFAAILERIAQSGASLAPGGTDVSTEEAAALRAENARLQEQVNGLVTAVAVIADDRGDAIQKELDQIRAIRKQFVGARP